MVQRRSNDAAVESWSNNDSFVMDKYTHDDDASKLVEGARGLSLLK